MYLKDYKTLKKKFSSIEKETNIKIKLDNYNYIILKVKILTVKFSKIVTYKRYMFNKNNKLYKSLTKWSLQKNYST